MTREELHMAINKGAPMYKAMRIEGVYDLNLCEKERYSFLIAHNKAKEDFKAMLKEYLRYEPKYFDNNLRYSIEASKETSISSITASKSVFIQNVISLLSNKNMPKISKLNREELKAYMKYRIDILADTRYASELEKEFPRLSKYYNDGKPIGERLFKEKENAEEGSPEYKKASDKIANFYRAGYNCNLSKFITTQVMIFNRMLDKFDEILGEIENITLTDEEVDCLNKDKLELLIAFKYLELVKRITDQITAEQCLYYVNNYLSEDIDSDVHIMIKGKIYTRDKLREEYLKLVMKRPELRLFNADREEFVGKNCEESQAIISSIVDGYDKKAATEVARKIRFKK